MRTIAVVFLGMLALAALLLLVWSIVPISGAAARRRSVSKPLMSAAAVFTVVFLVASCSASIVAPTGE